jgi:hypothetical protein
MKGEENENMRLCGTDPFTFRRLRLHHTKSLTLGAGVNNILNMNPRSFVSKYLHFHNPAVPIYDKVADSALRRKIRWKKSPKFFSLTNKMDPEYWRFVFRFWKLYQNIPESRIGGCVKLLDSFLWQENQTPPVTH